LTLSLSKQRLSCEEGQIISSKNKTGPTRCCALTAEIAPQDQLIRLCAGPKGELIADLAHRLGGRGMWIVPRRKALIDALSSKTIFMKALRRHIKVGEDFLEHLETSLTVRLTQRLGLLRKSGLLIIGANTIRTNANKIPNKIQGLLIGDDASEAEAKKLCRAFSSCWYCHDIPSHIIGEAVGRGSVAYAGIMAGSDIATRRAVRQLHNDIFRLHGIFGRENAANQVPFLPECLS